MINWAQFKGLDCEIVQFIGRKFDYFTNKLIENKLVGSRLSTLFKYIIINYYTKLQVDEIGGVLSVGDGIARYELTRFKLEKWLNLQGLQKEWL
jgi:hypothetical protein